MEEIEKLYPRLEGPFGNRFVDRTGQKYGRLTLMYPCERVPRKEGIMMLWLARCDCGNYCKVAPNQLTRKDKYAIHSCGCWRRDIHTTHGLSGGHGNESRLYKEWCRMRTRATNPNITDADHYYLKGVRCCKEWDDYKTFYEWAMSHGYSDDLSIDRIDWNGDYCPENCRWATDEEQARNTSRNRIIEFKGESHCVSEWEDILGFRHGTLHNRIDTLGWSVELALTEPIRKR